MGNHFVISVLAEDKPGIIADVTNVIYDLKGDLADMSQSVLNGFFSMIIQSRFDESVSETILLEKLRSIDSSSELHCLVKEIKKPSPSDIPEQGETYVVTAQGKNRTGLVASVSAFCRDNKINITGYDTKLSGQSYSMMLDINLPEEVSPDEIHDKLSSMGKELGLKIVMQHKDLFETVNEISLF